MSRLLDEDPEAGYMTRISDHDLKTRPQLMKMAEYAVTENNKKAPKSETLKLVSLDRGYYLIEAGADTIIFDLYIIVSSAHLGQIKYKAEVHAGEPGHEYYLTSFTRL
ncbi:unnamed protein product [Linum tenue]|uniref:Uncharacterized protein n=1 Tax=Linum tenue TaxID=586396 RepID=A0AAV0PEK0_9ROSI|nr:unnamed protein product [Linum tenue]